MLLTDAIVISLEMGEKVLHSEPSIPSGADVVTLRANVIMVCFPRDLPTFCTIQSNRY